MKKISVRTTPKLLVIFNMSQCEKEDVSATVSAPLEESSRDLSSMDEKEREYDKEKDEGEQQNTTAGKAEEVTYPHGFKLAMLTVSIMLAVFIMALDTTVIGTPPFFAHELPRAEFECSDCGT